MSRRKTNAMIDGFLSVYGLDAEMCPHCQRASGFEFYGSRIRSYWARAVDTAIESEKPLRESTDEGLGADAKTAS